MRPIQSSSAPSASRAGRRDQRHSTPDDIDRGDSGHQAVKQLRAKNLHRSATQLLDDAMKELRTINLFRATAAYWVLIGHCRIWGGWQEFWVPDGKMAVDLFMVISGFLMAAHAIDRAPKEPLSGDSNWRSNWRRFWIRRFFRIAPAY